MGFSWDESSPGDGDLLGQGASAIRGLKENVALGVTPSMYWPGSGGGSAASAGVMRLGSLRAFYETNSLLSLGADTGRLFYASDVSRLYYVNSSVSTLAVGHAWGIEKSASDATSVRYVVSTGTTYAGAGPSFPVTYAGIPQVLLSFVTLQTEPTYPVAVRIDSITPTGFTVSGWSLDESNEWAQVSGFWIDWMSIGTVAL